MARTEFSRGGCLVNRRRIAPNPRLVTGKLGHDGGDIMPATTNSRQPTPHRLGQIAWAFAAPLIVEAAVKHRMFDVLDRGPRTLEDLAREVGASPRGLRAIVNALVALDLLSRDAERRYALTPESAAFLVSTRPSFQGGIFRHISSHLMSKWLQLPEIVR